MFGPLPSTRVQNRKSQTRRRNGIRQMACLTSKRLDGMRVWERTINADVEICGDPLLRRYTVHSGISRTSQEHAWYDTVVMWRRMSHGRGPSRWLEQQPEHPPALWVPFEAGPTLLKVEAHVVAVCPATRALRLSPHFLVQVSPRFRRTWRICHKRVVAEQWLDVTESAWFQWVPPPGLELTVGADAAAQQVEVRSCDLQGVKAGATCRCACHC